MKKRNYIFTLLAAFALVFVSCSDNNVQDEIIDYPVNLDTPVNADKTVFYQLPVALAPVSSSSFLLKSFDITESNKIVVELRDSETNRPVYLMGDVSQKDNTYTITGDKVKGNIVTLSNSARITRQSSSFLIIDLVIIFGDEIRYVTEGETLIEATVTNSVNLSEEAMNRLARTWTVLGVIVDIKGSDIKAYEQFESINGIFDLNDVLVEAENQGISINEKDRAALQRKVKNVTVTKSQNFIVSYVDGGEDVAGWSWADAEKTHIKINLKDEGMGNLFLSNDTRLTISFRDNRCNIRLDTKIKDNNGKIWDGSLTLLLQS